MNRDVLIIYKSIYNGNTKKIAEAMGKKLSCSVVTCDQAEKIDVSKYKYVGLGSGIYFTSHHPEIFKLSERLSSKQKVFIFSTHGAPFVGKYHNVLKKQLSDRNISVIGEFSCRGYDCTGPYNIVCGGNKAKPSEKDKRKAKKFVAEILPMYAEEFKVSKGKHVEVNQITCIGCGKCASVCPMKVFVIKDKKSVVVNEEDCIHCNLCTDNCSENSVAVNHTFKELIMIAKNNAWRKSL